AQVGSCPPGGFVLVNAGEVKAGQEVHGLETGIGECFEVLGAIGAAVGEGEVRSAMSGRHGRVIGAEIADVQFVDAEIVHAGERGRTRLLPSVGLGVAVVQVGDATLHAVEGEVDRVGIGDDVLQNGALARYVDMQVVQIVFVGPGIIDARAPHAVVFLHGGRLGGNGVGSLVE